MESYTNPDIIDIINREGNSVCNDCGDEKVKWASVNNGIMLCLKCAGVHRSLGMNISHVRSLQIDSWSENQLLYLIKGGNNNFKKNLSEFNIDISSASVDVKYKSKAADYYRKVLKNEVDRESNPNYVPTQIVKPDLNEAQNLIENNTEEAKKGEEKSEKKSSFFGVMGSFFSKVKDKTTDAAKKVGKGITDLKIKEKLKIAGNAIAEAAKTSGNFIANNTQKAVNNIKAHMKKDIKYYNEEKKDEKSKTEVTKQVEGNNEENKKDEKIENDKKEEQKQEEIKIKDEDKKIEDKKDEDKNEDKKEQEIVKDENKDKTQENVEQENKIAQEQLDANQQSEEKKE